MLKSSASARGNENCGIMSVGYYNVAKGCGGFCIATPAHTTKFIKEDGIRPYKSSKKEFTSDSET